MTERTIYKKSTYQQATGNTYKQVMNYSGLRGEYFTYKELGYIEQNGGRFLFNLYIPKSAHSNQVTEIDLVAVTHYGVLVIESKNLSGWIFGNENSKKWCQSLRDPNRGGSQKNFFYNPISQNKGHIEALKQLLMEHGINVPFWNIVVLSNHCEIKKMSVTSKDVVVVKRDGLKDALREINEGRDFGITEEGKMRIYNLLYPYSQVSEEVKKKHLDSVQSINRKDDPVERPVATVATHNVVNQQQTETVTPVSQEKREEQIVVEKQNEIDSGYLRRRRLIIALSVAIVVLLVLIYGLLTF